MKKNYEEKNKYNFKIHYYKCYAKDTKYEQHIEISKKEYFDLSKKTKELDNAMIKIYKTYTVGFYKNPGTYVIQEVDKQVYECLYNSQRYERNKKSNESRRHLDDYFKQDDFKKMPSEDNVEDEVLNKIEKEDIKKFLDSILFEKQSDRFFQNIIDGIPIVVIAIKENADPSSVRESIERAKKTILKKSKKYKNF